MIAQELHFDGGMTITFDESCEAGQSMCEMAPNSENGKFAIIVFCSHFRMTKGYYTLGIFRFVSTQTMLECFFDCRHLVCTALSE
jgi:hypothetical protein